MDQSQRIVEDLIAGALDAAELVPAEHRGISFERVSKGFHPQENTRRLERALAIVWAERNAENSSNGWGQPILPTILFRHQDDPRASAAPQNAREWEVACCVAATVMQWLGTTIGTSTLHEAYRRAGCKFTLELPQVHDDGPRR